VADSGSFPPGGAGDLAESFPPIADGRARVLVLGSMPGRASIRAGEYYAHPRNLFWALMQAILAIPRDAPYAVRCDALRERRIAVWDVLATCTRPGSLDSAIDDATAVPNDFGAFLERHRGLQAIGFNGAKAEQVFTRRVVPVLGPAARRLDRVRLPSTSPANASVSFDAKLSAWRAFLD
jgi:TDG/mug DNA glycosylase family protein